MGWRNGSARRSFVQLVDPLVGLWAGLDARSRNSTNRPSAEGDTQTSAAGKKPATPNVQFATNPRNCALGPAPLTYPRPSNTSQKLSTHPPAGGFLTRKRVTSPFVSGSGRQPARDRPVPRPREPAFKNSGEGGIRTPERGQPPLRDFQSRPFNRSGTSPKGRPSVPRGWSGAPRLGGFVPWRAGSARMVRHRWAGASRGAPDPVCMVRHSMGLNRCLARRAHQGVHDAPHGRVGPSRGA